MRKALLTVLAALAISGIAQAAGTSKEPERTKEAVKGKAGRYGDAGCGLGSMAFGNDPGGVQILAATTNGTFGTQTFGITSGTSNCAGLSGVAATKVFIEANREALAKDISRGSGETIATLTWITGCGDSQAVGAKLQKSFGAIFPNESVSNEAVTDAIVKTLRSDKSLGCGNIG